MTFNFVNLDVLIKRL